MSSCCLATCADPVDPGQVEERLRADVDHELKAVLVVQTDTATSVRNDLLAIRQAIDAANHPALYMVDAVASLGSEPFEMDGWGIDVTVGASQKGLIMPPGLAFVWANEKALALHETADLNVAYFDWGPRAKPDTVYQLFAGTPPVPHLYGLREALAMINEEGIEAIWARHRSLADAVRAAVDAWSTSGGVELNITDPAARSDATTTVLTGSIDGNELRRVCEAEAGLTLGIGFGPFEGRAFRLGHMGHLNPPSILGTLGTIEAALLSMKAPLGGSGAAAAAAVVGDAMPRQ